MPSRFNAPPRLTALEDRAVPAVVLSDNLSNAVGGSSAASGSRWLASSFRTDSSARTLTDVALKVGGGGTAEVDIYTDSNSSPAAEVATLATAATPTSPADTTFAGSVPLAADTTYWVVLKAASGSVDWTFTTDNSGTGAGFSASFAEADDAGATWFSGTIFPPQMRVTADGGATTAGPGVLAFSAATFAVTETVGTATVTVARTGGSTGAVTVPVTVTGGTAVSGTDFTASPAAVSFADGVTSATVTLTVTNDTAVEGTETLVLTLGTPGGGATLGGVTATTVSITDDDSPTGTPTNPVTLTAAAAGSAPSTVVVFNADGGTNRTLTPFPGFTGGARPATADLTGDGVDDVVVGAGPGGAPLVVVYNGATGAEVGRFLAFEASFTGGVSVALGDITEDGRADLAVAPDQGGGPVVAIYDGAGLAGGTGAGSQLTRFFGIEDPNFRGGARPALGDFTGDGQADLMVAAGFGGGPRVALFDGASLPGGSPVKVRGDFFAFESTLRNGAFVATDDVDGALVFAGGPGGGPRVRVFDPERTFANTTFQTLDEVGNAAQSADFFAGDANLRGGARVAVGDATGDGAPDLLVGSGEGEGSRVRVYTNTALAAGTPTPDREFDPFALSLAGGVFVG